MVTHIEETDSRKLSREVMRGLLELATNYRVRIVNVVTALDLSPPQAFLLRLLEPGSHLTMGALAGALACDASNVTGLVDRLEARGLIERLTLPHDRRVKAIALTSEGELAREKFVQALLTPTPELAAMKTRDLQSTVAALARLSAALGGEALAAEPDARPSEAVRVRVAARSARAARKPASRASR